MAIIISAGNVELIFGISKVGTLEKSDFSREMSEEQVGLLSGNSNAAAHAAALSNIVALTPNGSTDPT